jgi:LAO/AO transport system kinase
MSERDAEPGNARQRPEWTPPGGGEGFASFVVPGTPDRHAGAARSPWRRQRGLLPPADYVKGIEAGDRTLLARAITLVESNASAHEATAQAVLQELLPRTGGALRVGVTGVPGAGKSTFIEALGMRLVEQGKRVAVLAIDPSSSVTRGSILGDKTRMERLAREPRAFIRPSPSGGALGGVARKTRETMLLCEAYGFDVILLETVGVGQSEVTVRSMTDFFLFLAIAGAGDELQGIKKGVIELADAIVVNKADGDNVRRARLAKAEYNRVLSFLAPATEGWQTKAHLLSALTGDGIGELWERVEAFTRTTVESGVRERRRQRQTLEWFRSMLHEGVLARFYSDPAVQNRLQVAERAIESGELPVTAAVRQALGEV